MHAEQFGQFRAGSFPFVSSFAILLRDYGELVALCKLVWKTHIPVRTQKWPPRLIFAGACHSKAINYGYGQ